MCRAVQDDEEFARWFLTGPNPVMLRRCIDIPTDRFPVTDDMVAGLLDRTQRLADEARVIMQSISLMKNIIHQYNNSSEQEKQLNRLLVSKT